MVNEVRDVQQRFDQAELMADQDTLRELIAEDFQSIGPKGFVLNKEQWIGRHGHFTYHELNTSEVDVRRYGDHTAIVRNVQRNRATYQGEESVVATRVSQVWVHHAGSWRLVAIQFSPLAEK